MEASAACCFYASFFQKRPFALLGVATGIGSMHRCAAVLATPRVRGARQVSQPRRLEAYGTSIRTPSTGGWQSQESDAQRRKRQQLRKKILILSRCRDRPPNRSSPVLTGPFTGGRHANGRAQPPVNFTDVLYWALPKFLLLGAHVKRPLGAEGRAWSGVVPCLRLQSCMMFFVYRA